MEKKKKGSKVLRLGAVLIQHTKTPAGVQNNLKSQVLLYGSSVECKVSPSCLTINSPINLETP